MPNIKSAEKRVKVAQTKELANSMVKTRYKTAVRKFEEMLAENKLEEAEKELVTAVKTIDKAVTKGIIKKNSGARKKSILARKLNEAKK